MVIDQHVRSFTRLEWVVLSLFISLFYVLSGNSSYWFAEHFYTQPLLAIHNGFALAMVMVYGFKPTLPAFLLGSIIITFQRWEQPIVVIGMVLGTLTELTIGCLFLKLLMNGRLRFKGIMDVFRFIVISAFLAPFVSSTIFVGSLYYGELLSVNWIQKIWVEELITRSLGILIITPLILSLYSTDKKRIMSWEALVLFTALIVTCYLVFGQAGGKVFIIIPLITWSALRFGFRGVGLAALIIGHVAVWKSFHVGYVFSYVSPEEDRQLTQFIMCGAAIVGYFLATVVAAHQVVQEKELELTIKEDALAILDQSIHKSPIGFGLIDRDLKYIRVNEALAKLNGVEANAHLGRSVFDVIPMAADSTVPIIHEVFRTGKSFMNLPYSGHPPRNRNEFVAGLLSYYPVRHPSTHEIFAVAFSFQDITEQQMIQSLLSENQERLKFAQSAGKIGAFEWDPVSNMIMWTSELENIYELDPGEFGGYLDSWMKWVHPQDIDELKDEIEKVFHQRKELDHQFRIITKNGNMRWILARGRVITSSDNKQKFIGINIDITEQKITEYKLRLTETNLLHALSVRDEFLAIASHELKTPLTSLKLQNQIFQRGLARNENYTQEKVKTFIEKNCVQIDRLTRLVDDMLDISRIRTGKFTIKKEMCDLNRMISDILVRTREQFEASGSGQPVIESFDPVSGEWDPLRIDQVLTNIITNAIRYGQGKPITISVKNYNESVRVSVRDQGLGIPKSDQTKIFQRYERGMLAREVSGLGLGLFISKQIIDAHGGKIWVESEVNKGSTFYIDLPRKAAVKLLSPEIPTEVEG